MRLRKSLVALAGLSLLVGATVLPAATAAQDQSKPRIVVVTHGQAADAFWSVVKNGVDAAKTDMNVDVEYALQEKFDLVKMGQDIDAAVASKPNGLVVSIPDVDAVGPNIKAAVDAGIPVISINSGSDVYKDLGVLIHIGQTEYEAGVGGGERMAAAGGKNAICFNQEVGNVALDLRCQGFTDAFTKAGGKVQLVTGEISDPTAMANSVLAAIQSDPTIDSIMTLGPSASTPILNALKEQGKIPGINMGTFDLSPEVLQALVDGEMLFAIDQQQYLQGYLPIVFLKEYITHGLIPGGGGVVLTGPGFVTKDNAAQVIDLSSKGIR
jgi:simple sugar transport system substrate-binding protein